MSEVVGFILGIVAGVALGVMGGGGSILTVPILVYFLSVQPVLATSYSLFIVGTSAMIGAISYARYKLVNYELIMKLGVPSMIAVYVTQRYILPAIPQTMDFNFFVLDKDVWVMILFALTMIAASRSMIKGRKEKHVDLGFWKHPLTILQGLGIGVLAGMVGAGGGFLLVPALILIGKLPMKQAVGTSLSIICIQSLLGFIGKHNESHSLIDWNFLLLFTSMVVLGIFAGLYLSKYISGKRLKPAFGWFVLVMGAFILSKEILNF